MKKKIFYKHPYLTLLAFSAVFALISIFYINVGDLQHDYTFHLGRLAGLVQSFEHGDFLPNLNFAFTSGVGYASPMFYGNWQLYLPALLYLVIPNVLVVYTFYAFLLTYALACAMYFAVVKIGHRPKRALTAAFLSTMVLTWFGYGMTMVAAFVPLLVYAMYKVLYQNKTNPVLLGVIIGLLIQTHLLSTMVLAFSCLIFVLLNVKRWSGPKILSFVQSAGIGLVLASGFLIQYFEQAGSQTFFFHWTAREYPFKISLLLRTTSLFEAIFRSPYIPMVLVLIFLLTQFKKLTPVSKQLVIVCVITFLLQTNWIPGISQLKQTPVMVLQDLRRISFFVPLLVIMACALSMPLGINRLALILQTIFYLFGPLLANVPTADTFETIAYHQQVFDQSISDPDQASFTASGVEYFTVDINPANTISDTFGIFTDLNNVEITNIEKGYNSLEFDYRVLDESQPGSFIAPRVWYKGYQIEYSNGGQGSQPALKKIPPTEQQIALYKEKQKPAVDEEVLYDGKISLEVQGSGHIRLYYQKTGWQIFGFVVETMAWIVLGGYCLWKYLAFKADPNSKLAGWMQNMEERWRDIQFKLTQSLKKKSSSM